MIRTEQLPFIGLELRASFGPAALDPLKDAIQAHMPSFLPDHHGLPEERQLSPLARIEAAAGTRPRVLEEMIAEIVAIPPRPSVVQRLGVVAHDGLISLEIGGIELGSVQAFSTDRLKAVNGRNLRSRFKVKDTEVLVVPPVKLGMISRAVNLEKSRGLSSVQESAWARGVLPISLYFAGVFEGQDVHTMPVSAEQTH